MQRGLERARRKASWVCIPEAAHTSNPLLAASSDQALPWTSLHGRRNNLGLQTANFEQPLGKMATELELLEGHSRQPMPTVTCGP